MTTRREFMDRMFGSAVIVAPLPHLADWSGAGRSYQPGLLDVAAVHDVTEYGADPKGESDSTDGFQSTLDALPAKGGIVRVPSGDYRVDRSIEWPSVGEGSDVLKPALLQGGNPSVIKGVAEGWSAGTSTVVFTGQGPLFDLRLGSGRQTRFSGGFVNLSFHGQGRAGTTGLEAFRVRSAQFRNLVVRNFDVGVRVAESSFYSIWGSRLFSDAVKDGCQFHGAINGSGFHRLRFASNGRHGARLKRAGVPVYFDGCWFEGNGSRGVSVVDATHLRIVGSYFEGNGEAGVHFRSVKGGARAGAISVVDSYFRPVKDGHCLDIGSVPARARLLDVVANGDHEPSSVVRVGRDTPHSLVAVGGSRDGTTPVPLLGVGAREVDLVAFGDDFARDDERLRSSHVLDGKGSLRFMNSPVEFPSMTTGGRPSAGRAGRVIYNPEEETLNIDTESRWVRP